MKIGYKTGVFLILTLTCVSLMGAMAGTVYHSSVSIGGGPTDSDGGLQIEDNGNLTSSGDITTSGDLTVTGNTTLSTLDMTTPLPIAEGGTGADSEGEAQEALGLGTVAVLDSPLPVANGGTGSSDAASARTALGLGTIATQNASSVSATVLYAGGGFGDTGTTLGSDGAISTNGVLRINSARIEQQSGTTGALTILDNIYYSGGWKYYGDGAGVVNYMGTGTLSDFVWYTAPVNSSGAGATATLTERMRLAQNGKLTVDGQVQATSMKVYDTGLSLISFGAEDTSAGLAFLYGSGTTGGWLSISNAGDGDGTVNSWDFRASPEPTYSGDLVLYYDGGSGPVGVVRDDTKNLEWGATVKADAFTVDGLNTAPASATATGTTGEIRITSGYIYVCTATNTWKRCALSTF